MKFFVRIRKSTGSRILKRNFGNMSRNRSFRNFYSSKKCGILFDSTDPESFTQIRQFSKSLEKENIKTMLLGFVSQETIPNEFLLWENCRIITLKDLDWLYRPLDIQVSDFIHEEFDILFDFTFKEELATRWISLLSRAKFKVGRYKETENDTDMMIRISDDSSMKYFIEQSIYYVNMLNTN